MKRDRTKENIKSVHRESGLGNMKVGLNRHKKMSTDECNVTQLRIKCPICGEDESRNLIERRWDFWECRTCGFMHDIDRWSKRKGCKRRR